ncbi:PH domain-containing protein [Natronosporangium hydrolyticum]|uniref:PH domain-containing protein n=1 Tax=Natronosporangium hydrolyticum TaxID=2811111 RepID=A0A895YGQ5_9ACTN|nr:PH domain-containing protein [Natronosporangium hydrolyticum]QSB15272.1 PH domain-containing protein [Natronosporangium hydrolyticum]
MAFPENILTEDEKVVMHLHPHWREMVRPVFVFLLGVAVVAAAWWFLPEDGAGEIGLYVIGGLAIIAVLWLSVWPWIVWRTTHYVFTNERVVLQFGIFHRERRDIPLHRVNNHTMNQTLVDRFFRCGTLIIESAGQDGTTELKDMPKVHRVQTLLYELVDSDRDRHSLGDQQFREILEGLNDGKQQ